MKIIPAPIQRTHGEKIFFNMRHRERAIDLQTLTNELNKACADGTKPSLEILQEARDIIEALAKEYPGDIVYNALYGAYEIKNEAQ